MNAARSSAAKVPEIDRLAVLQSTSRRPTISKMDVVRDTRFSLPTVSEILATRERRGLAERTYLIFTSDHGEMLGDHALCSKQAAYEPSATVPLFAAGPGITCGTSTDARVDIADLDPTIRELAGLSRQERLDARSFQGVLGDFRQPHRCFVLSGPRKWRSIRTERFKHIDNHNDRDEL